MTLGGTLIVRNAFEYDYCLEAAVNSLLQVCHKVVVVDGNSTDGTFEQLVQLGYRYNNVNSFQLYQQEWKPSAMGTWLADLTNFARLKLDTDMHLNLQADEVLHEADYPLIRELANIGGIFTLERLNFWLNHRYLLPPNEKVGSTIVRLAPVEVPSVGDAQGLAHDQGWSKSAARIFHYGFIRDAKKLVAKSRPMQQAFFNTQDPIWDAVEQEGLKALGDAKHATAVPRERLVPFKGTHPKVVRPWLAAHGYEHADGHKL